MVLTEEDVINRVKWSQLMTPKCSRTTIRRKVSDGNSVIKNCSVSCSPSVNTALPFTFRAGTLHFLLTAMANNLWCMPLFYMQIYKQTSPSIYTCGGQEGFLPKRICLRGLL